MLFKKLALSMVILLAACTSSDESATKGDSSATLPPPAEVLPVSSSNLRRLALVIGNSDYAEYNFLTNPVKDAKALAKVLRQLNFEVIERTNLNRLQMKAAVRQFSNKLAEQQGVGLFYFSGHGLQYQGVNYLIPIGALQALGAVYDLPDETVTVDYVLSAMKTVENKINLLILDACRNPPRFVKGWYKGDMIPPGLALPQRTPGASLIAYAAAPGKVALSGEGQNNSPYVKSLMKWIQVPNLSIMDALTQVRNEVIETTYQQQEPEFSVALNELFYFNPQALEQQRLAREKEQLEAERARLAQEREAMRREQARLQAEAEAEKEAIEREKARLEAEQQRLERERQVMRDKYRPTNCGTTRLGYDIVFAVDSTAGMGEYFIPIAEVLQSFIKHIEDVARCGEPKLPLRIGLLFYKDRLKNYTRCPHPFQITEWKQELTHDIDKVIDALKYARQETCTSEESGEAMLDGLNRAIVDTEWWDYPFKAIVLIGDAAPHPENDDKNPMNFTVSGIGKIAEQKKIRFLTFKLGSDDKTFMRLAYDIKDEQNKGRYKAIPKSNNKDNFKNSLLDILVKEWRMPTKAQKFVFGCHNLSKPTLLKKP